MAQEGLDIGHLNVVMLCTPKSQIKQSVGRILRAEVYEQHPIVIDLVDEDNSVFNQQSNKRDAYYTKQHYHIQRFKISDYKKKGYTMWNDKETVKQALLKVPEKKSGKQPYKPTYVPKVYEPVNCDNMDFSEEI